MSDWIEADTGTVRALAQQLNAALGYPRGPDRVVGKQRTIVREWDGRGPVPWGWIVSPINMRRVSAGLVAIEVDDRVRSAGVELPAVETRDGNYLRTAARVDPYEDRTPERAITLDEAFARRWGADAPLPGAADRRRRNGR